MQICDTLSTLHSSDSAREKLPSMLLQRKHVRRPEAIEDPLQGSAIGPEEEELAPEALGAFWVIFGVLLNHGVRISRLPAYKVVLLCVGVMSRKVRPCGPEVEDRQGGRLGQAQWGKIRIRGYKDRGEHTPREKSLATDPT